MFLSNASVLVVAVFCFVSISVSRAREEVDGRVNAEYPCPWTGPTCIESCVGRQNGDYQSCHGCSTYASCLEQKISYVDCPSGTVWNDNLKRCYPTSNTCYCFQEAENCTTTGPRCIRSCSGLQDGDYQSCHGCSVYVTCVGGYLYDYRPCNRVTPPFKWDDYSRKCLPSSNTCKCTRSTETMPDRLRWSRILKI